MSHSAYLLLLFGLFVVPLVLQRYRIPTGITSFALGAACALQAGLFTDDHVVRLLATLGIVSLFLFAGLDVDLRELRRQAGVLTQHVAIQALSLTLLALGVNWLFELPTRPATLVALALLTPSTGFILDALDSFGLSENARFWIKSKAVATELVALTVLFIVLRSTTLTELGISTVALVAMVAFLPLLFRGFASVVMPYAPKSEFSFLMLLAVACGVVTHELGVYYLVGAFVVGMAAQRLRKRLPNMASDRMLSSVESFASLFVPFYFFNAGLGLSSDSFTLEGIGIGLLFVAIGIPLRLLPLWLHRRLLFGESLRTSLNVGIPMLPTLVFTLVIAGVLRTRFGIDPALFGGLVVYTILSSLIPGLVLRKPLPEVEDELLLDEPLPSGLAPPAVPAELAASEQR